MKKQNTKKNETERRGKTKTIYEKNNKTTAKKKQKTKNKTTRKKNKPFIKIATPKAYWNQNQNSMRTTGRSVFSLLSPNNPTEAGKVLLQ